MGTRWPLKANWEDGPSEDWKRVRLGERLVPHDRIFIVGLILVENLTVQWSEELPVSEAWYF